MTASDPPLETRLAQRNISRRDFLKFCGMMAATLALPAAAAPHIARSLAAASRLPVIWLGLQDCTADTESFLRANNPTVSDILFNLISLDYHETLMVPSGDLAERSLQDTLDRHSGQYVAIIEGAIPTAMGGAYCTIGGRSALERVQQVCNSALQSIAVGGCAWDGGWPAASPNPTMAVGVAEAVPGLTRLINLPGCPMNVVNLTACLVQYLTYGTWPQLDSLKRPIFAYGTVIHDKCERRGHYNNNRFVLAWGDEGHRKGWCLFKMGCRGPRTRHNCPTVKWNDATSWPVAAGHGCIGCAVGDFWDTMTPFYQTLPSANAD